MDFIHTWFPDWFSWLSNSAGLVLILIILKITVSQKFPLFNQWLWAVFFLSIIWFMRASLESGINMHLSGAMLMALMFGWRMGFLGMCLVNIITNIFNDALFVNLGVAIMVNALLPVSLSYIIFLLIEAKLPRHFFIYIFGTAFFGSWIMSIMTGVVIALLLGVFDAFSWPLLTNEFLPYYFLMGFPEAFLTAGLVTLFVVFRPEWVYTFRDSRYLRDK